MEFFKEETTIISLEDIFLIPEVRYLTFRHLLIRERCTDLSMMLYLNGGYTLGVF